VSTVSYGRDFGADAMLVAFTRPFRLGLGPKPNHEKEKLWFYGDFTIGSVVAGTWRIVPPRPDAIPGDWWRQLTFPLQHPFLLPLPNMRLPLADVDPIGFDRGSVSVVVARDTKKTRSYELEGLEIDDAGVRDGLYRVDMEIRNVKWGPWTER
jgi:hypothetical protein